MSKSAHEKWKRGEQITRTQAVGAQCYICNGYSVEKAHDCGGISCPLYAWSPWGRSRGLRPAKRPKRNVDRKEKIWTASL
jgi:hypothetical protein